MEYKKIYDNYVLNFKVNQLKIIMNGALALKFKTNYPKNLYINLNNFNGKCHKN